MSESRATGNAARLVALMARLRDPACGCPWDQAQTFATIAPYTIEEAYEVADAIDRADLGDLQGELGDLLFQVAFHARMAEEAGAFTFDDVVNTLCEKMESRHPHVFGNAPRGSADAQPQAWEARKAQERINRGEHDTSALAGITRGLPEWQRALKLQSRAARTGFTWATAHQVLEKLQEETAELDAALASGDAKHIEEEWGDLLFAALNIARLCQFDAGSALRGANAKFERRFRAMEALAQAQGQPFDTLSLEAQTALWQRVKSRQ